MFANIGLLTKIPAGMVAVSAVGSDVESLLCSFFGEESHIQRLLVLLLFMKEGD